MEKSKEVFDSIISYIREHGYPPTYDEIGDMNGFNSKATTAYHMQKLMDAGMIETDNPNSARAIRVPEYEFVKLECGVNLKAIKTCDLVKELKTREGVQTECAEPYTDKEIIVNGPANILIVTD